MFGEEMKMDSGKWADSESVKTDLVRFSQASIITLAPTQSKKKNTKWPHNLLLWLSLHYITFKCTISVVT